MYKLYVLQQSPLCNLVVKELKSNPYLLSIFTLIDASLPTKQRTADGVAVVPTIITFDQRKYEGEAAVPFIKEQLKVCAQQPHYYTQLVYQFLTSRIQSLESRLARLEEEGKITPRGTQTRFAQEGPLEMESTEDSALLKPTVIITKPKKSLDATAIMQQRRNFHPHAR